MAEEKEQMHDENALDAKRAEGPSSSDEAQASAGPLPEAAPAAAQETAGGDASGKAQEPKEGKKKRRLVMGAIIAALLALLLVGLAMCHSCADDWLDPSARDGSYAGKSQEQIIADLNANVQEGMMNISVATVMQGKEGSDTVNVRFENIAANHWDQKCTITLDETGEELWQSGAIKPGQSIDDAKLSRTFEAGAYPVTATVTGYDSDTHEEKGKLAGKVTLYIAARQ